MRYAYHFEFCERPELPEWFRGDLFLALAWVQRRFGLSRVLRDVVPDVLSGLVSEQGARGVIELGAGSGEGLIELANACHHLPATFSFRATDKFPQIDLWRNKLDYFSESIDFENFVVQLGEDRIAGQVLFFSAAFHHLSSEAARGFLEKAAGVGAHVLVVEPLERTWFCVLLGALTSVPGLLYPLFARGLSFFRRLRVACFQWLLPAASFFLSHDGITSAFRQRTNENWTTLAGALPFEFRKWGRLGLLGNYSVVLLTNRNTQTSQEQAAD